MKNISVKILFFLLIPSIASARSFYAHYYNVLVAFHTVAGGSRGVSEWQRKEALKLVERACLVVGPQAEKDDEMLAFFKKYFKEQDSAFLGVLLQREEEVLSAFEGKMTANNCFNDV